MKKRLREVVDNDDVEVEVGSRTKKACGGSGSSSSSKEELKQKVCAYMKTVQERLGDKSDSYVKFTVFLRDFKARRVDLESLGIQIKNLFEGYPDLILGFNMFLPDGYKISLDDDEDGDDDEITYTEDEPETETEPETEEDEMTKSAQFLDAISFVNKVKMRFQSDKKHVYKAFLDVWDRNQKDLFTYDDVYNGVSQLLGDHPDLLHEFVRLLGSQVTPPPLQKASDDHQNCVNGCDPSLDDPDTEKMKDSLLEQGLRLCDKAEQVLSKPDYRDFLKLLHDYSYGKFSRDDLKAAATSILGSDRNLVEEFNVFVEAPGEHLSKLSKIEEKKKDLQLKEMKSAQELDLSNCERIGHSYFVLPEDFRDSSGRQRSEDDEVLNDKFICVSPEDGNYSFKHKHIQQHEQVMFKFEDDRFEMDVVMERIRSTIVNVKKLWNAMKKNKINLASVIKIEDHLNVVNMRCLERMYGDHALDMMEAIEKDPIKGLPRILKRLEQKQEELKPPQQWFNDVCTRTCAQIHLKKPEGKQQELSRESTASSSEEMQKEEGHEMMDVIEGNEQAAGSD
ncbi:hypothetical protein LWI28_020662 [Acer negundo]|uniref:Histone deacetylase interacting domain-containing protein n=1 Tax=Acer negundo TaxID=4023 RepID=A0AAD5JM15_ACENE|nr:hypothetical protein LWI28_020662 [Acer negundo]KAK4855994.1 hypothetical protein QYF36_013047 [Acer negundo]